MLMPNDEACAAEPPGLATRVVPPLPETLHSEPPSFLISKEPL